MCPFKTNLILNKQVLRVTTWAGSSEEQNLERTAKTVLLWRWKRAGTRGKFTSNKRPDRRNHRDVSRLPSQKYGDKKPQHWTTDLVHTMSPPDLNQLSHFTRPDELLKRYTDEHHMSWNYSLKSPLKSVSAVFISIQSCLELTMPIIITSFPKIWTLSF